MSNLYYSIFLNKEEYIALYHLLFIANYDGDSINEMINLPFIRLGLKYLNKIVQRHSCSLSLEFTQIFLSFWIDDESNKNYDALGLHIIRFTS